MIVNKMNKILIALVLAVGLSGNTFASQSNELHYLCDPKIWERNYHKNEHIAHGFRIRKDISYAKEYVVSNDAIRRERELDVVINEYKIGLKVAEDRGYKARKGGTVAIIDRFSLKIKKGSYGFFKKCKVVDSWWTLDNELKRIQNKVKNFNNKNRKF